MLHFPVSKISKKITAALGLLFVIASCEMIAVNHPADQWKINTPDVWKAANSMESTRIATHWLEDCQDADLTKLVNEAMKANQDLQATAARLRAAKQSPIIARANLLPRLNASNSASQSFRSDGDDDRYGLNLSASWEIDLWGRLRDLQDATVADFDAAVAQFRGARLSLAALTTKSYANFISASQQLRLAEETQTSFEKNLRIIERNYKAGVPNVRALDVQLGRSNVSAAQRVSRDRQLERDNAARSLEILLGRYPSATIAQKDDLPKISQSVAVGIPANIIERRPDLVAARARLYASARRADAARKNLLPSLSLTGSTGETTNNFAKLLDLDSLVSQLGANLTQNLFTGGANPAEARAALERNRAAIHDYAQLCLEAFREIETTIATEHSLAEQETFLRKEVEQAALAEKQSERDYSEGLEGAEILSVLESQRRANNARSSLIRLRNQRFQARIDLHLALGGSF